MEDTDPPETVSAFSTTKPRILLFDVDGCVVDSSDRARKCIDHEAKRRGDWEAYYRSLALNYSTHCDGDRPIVSGIEVISALCAGLLVERAIATTMRGEESRAMTLGYLQKYLPFDFRNADLYMSKGRWVDDQGRYYHPGEKDEYLSSVEQKRKTALMLKKNYDVVIAVDDHPDICVMYREIGIPALMMLHPRVDCLSPVGDRSLLNDGM